MKISDEVKIKILLKKALFVLIFDISNVTNVKFEDSDEKFIDEIIGILIQQNANICPFKNYDCIGECSSSSADCVSGIKITCKRAHNTLWKEFIGRVVTV